MDEGKTSDVGETLDGDVGETLDGDIGETLDGDEILPFTDNLKQSVSKQGRYTFFCWANAKWINVDSEICPK